MELKDISPMEWHNFKKNCPNVRLVFNERVDEIKSLKEENDKFKNAIEELRKSALPYKNESGEMRFTLGGYAQFIVSTNKLNKE